MEFKMAVGILIFGVVCTIIGFSIGLFASDLQDYYYYKPQAKEYYDLYLNAKNKTYKLQNQLESLQIKISKIEDILNENCEV